MKTTCRNNSTVYYNSVNDVYAHINRDKQVIINDEECGFKVFGSQESSYVLIRIFNHRIPDSSYHFQKYLGHLLVHVREVLNILWGMGISFHRTWKLLFRSIKMYSTA